GLDGYSCACAVGPAAAASSAAAAALRHVDAEAPGTTAPVAAGLHFVLSGCMMTSVAIIKRVCIPCDANEHHAGDQSEGWYGKDHRRDQSGEPLRRREHCNRPHGLRPARVEPALAALARTRGGEDSRRQRRAAEARPPAQLRDVCAPGDSATGDRYAGRRLGPAPA